MNGQGAESAFSCLLLSKYVDFNMCNIFAYIGMLYFLLLYNVNIVPPIHETLQSIVGHYA